MRRMDPDLQQVRRLGLAVVELTVGNACACAHALNISGQNGRPIAERVLVGQGALQDIGDNLHIPMRMRPKSATRGNPVLIYHPKVSKLSVFRIVVVCKGKAMERLQPAMVCKSACA